MNETYFTPHCDAEAEVIEKKSRFIGHLWRVETEDEAVAMIQKMREKYWDASHNTYAYRLRKNGISRYSDDGEPQGTAGRPILDVLTKENIENVCLVVTRYFGGTLLGAGGLTRTYGRTAKETLQSAGVELMTPWQRISIETPYHLSGSVRRLLEKTESDDLSVDYTEQVTFKAMVPIEKVERIKTSLDEISAGSLKLDKVEVCYHGKLIR